MRLVQILVPESSEDAVFDVLDDEGIDYLLTAEGSDREVGTVVQFPLPTEAVDQVLSKLRDAGLDGEYTVVIRAESVETSGFDDLEDRFITGEEQDDSVVRDEIRATALGMIPGRVTYYAMTLLSVLVATAGLLIDSPAVVVGSMVIAPQVGAALTASVGVVIDDRWMMSTGFRSQILGLALAVAGAAAFGWMLKTAEMVPPALDVATVTQISERTSPGVLSVTVGFAAGAAGAFGLATALPVSLVGVMIAAALIPAAAAVGVGIAWGYPAVTLGAGLLLVVNAAAINLAATVTFWYLGYRPEGWAPDEGLDNVTRARIGASALTLALLLAVFAGAGVVVADHVAFENDANEAVGDVLDREAYEDVELVAVRAEFTDRRFTGGDHRVTVIVSHSADERHPDLPEAISAAIAERTGSEVRVQVEYTERRTADASGDASSMSEIRVHNTS